MNRLFIRSVTANRLVTYSFFGLFTISSLITTGLFSFTENTAYAAAAQVQSTTCSNGSATTIGCTALGSSPVNGNTMIAVIGTRGTTTGRVSSITQTGATWVRATEVANANGITIEIWYASNVSGAGTAITVNLAATLKASAVVAEYSGLETSSVLDQVASTTGSSTSPSTNTTSTTTTADQLWIGGMANINTSTYSAQTNSFTEVAESASTGGSAATRNNVVLEEKIVSATGAANVGATLSATQQWAGAIATFKARAVPTKIAFTTAARTLTAGTCSGAGNVITMELQDASNNPATPTGSTVVRVSSDSPSETIYSDSSCSTPVTNGDFTFTTSETSKSFYIIDTRKSNPTWTLTAAKQSGPEALTDGTQSITTNAAAVSRLVLTLPGETFTDGTGNSGTATNRTAGSSFTITSISATDQYFNVNTGYSGSITLAYSGPGNAPLGTSASYTTSVSFTNGQSTTTLTTTLYSAETTTITATDGGSYGYASSSVTVDPGAINNYLVSATATNIAGDCVTGNSITARDQWNNTRSSDTSVVNMTTSGTGLTFYTTSGCGTSTTQYTLSGGTVNFFFRTTKKQSAITVTATKNLDTPSGTSGNITINPAAASALLIKLPGQTFTDGTGIVNSSSFTGLRSPNATAGTSFSVDIKAVDAYNNLVDSGVNNYTGAKTISFSNSAAGNAPDTTSPSFPGSVTFSNGAADGQVITYYNATTSRTVRADDTGTPITGTASSTFTVQAGAVQNYGVAASGGSQTAGVAFNVTITARDDYENALGSLYSAPAGTYIWTTTGANAPDSTAPNLGTLAQGNFTNGVATKSVTLYKAESGVTFTASEPGPSSVTGTSGTVTVTRGKPSGATGDSTITGNSTIGLSSPLTVTITLRDTWRNPISSMSPSGPDCSGYQISVAGTGSPTINQPASSTDSNGQTTADLTWGGTGSKTVSVLICGASPQNELVQNDGSTPDADGYLDDTLAVTVNMPSADARLQGGTTIRGGTRL